MAVTVEKAVSGKGDLPDRGVFKSRSNQDAFGRLGSVYQVFLEVYPTSKSHVPPLFA
jgi:hypothetical protein